MGKICPFMSGPVVMPIYRGDGDFDYIPEANFIDCIGEDCKAWKMEVDIKPNHHPTARVIGHCQLIGKTGREVPDC